MDQPDDWEEDNEEENEDEDNEEEKELPEMTAEMAASIAEQIKEVLGGGYPDEGNHPEVDKGRRDDRARVWWLSKVDVLGLSDFFEQLYENEETLLDAVLENEPEANTALIQLTRLLHEVYPDTERDFPQRGDLVYLEHELKRKGMSGKYFYDGSNVVTFEIYEDDIALPHDFEIAVEFPLRYWKGRLRGHYFVPFNFPQYFPNVGLGEIKLRGDIPYYEFYIEDERFIIYPNIYEDPALPMEPPSVEKFFEWITGSTYLTTFDSRAIYKQEYLRIFNNVDPDHTLFVEQPI